MRRRKYDAFGRPVGPDAPDPQRAVGRTVVRPDGGTERGAAAPTGDGRATSSSARPRGTSPWPDAPSAGRLVVRPGEGEDGRGAPSGRRTVASVTKAVTGSAFAVLVLLAVVGAVAGDPDDGGGTTGRGDGRSITASGATRTLARMRAEIRPDERVLSVSLGDTSSSVRLRTATGTRSVLIGRDGDLSTYEGSTTSTTERGVPLADLDAGAPGRLVAAVRRGLGPGSRARIDSVFAYASEDEPLRWSASVDGGDDDERSWRGDDEGRRVVRTRDGAPAPAPGETGPARVPEGVSGRSLLRAANLRLAVLALREAVPDAREIGTLTVRPERILSGLRLGDRQRLVNVDAALGTDLSALTSVYGRTSPVGSVDPEGPERALRLIARRTGDPVPDEVTATLSTADPSLGGTGTAWRITLGEGRSEDDRWVASADGRRVGASGEQLRP